MDIENLRSELAHKLTQLLKDDEAGWHEAARSIDSKALQDGVDLAADFDSVEKFLESLVEGMRFHVDLK